MSRPVLAVVLAATFAFAWRALRRAGSASPRGGPLDVAAVTACLLAAVFALKLIPAIVRPEALIRDDFLFPLWSLWERSGAWWWLVPAGAGIAGLLAARRRGLLDRLPAPVFLVGLAAAACVVWTTLSLTAGGWPDGLIRPFERDADYRADVARFSSVDEIWRTYVERQESLSLHGTTHPPGAVTLLFVLTRWSGGSLPLVCLAVVALGALTLVPLYLWARIHLDEPVARAACLIWVTTPSVLLYGATCMDMVFAVPLVASAATYLGRATIAARRGGDPPGRAAAWGALSGAMLGAGFLFTFSSAVLAIVYVGAAALALARRDGSGRGELARLAAAGLVCLGILGLAYVSGFDAWACLRKAMAIDARLAPAFRSASYWAITRLMGAMDFVVMSGFAAAALWLRGLGSRHDDPELAAGSRLAAGACLVLLGAGVYKIGETGRIWLFLLPFVVLAAARATSGRERAGGVEAIVVLDAAQAFLFEHFLDTRW